MTTWIKTNGLAIVIFAIGATGSAIAVREEMQSDINLHSARLVSLELVATKHDIYERELSEVKMQVNYMKSQVNDLQPLITSLTSATSSLDKTIALYSQDLGMIKSTIKEVKEDTKETKKDVQAIKVRMAQ